jgi:glycosyltransferase involved in cell wall biosynthesis
MIMKKLSFFLTTIGRPTLTDMLNSLENQLDIDDNVYLFVDGDNYWNDVDKQLNLFKTPKFNLIVNYEKQNLGFWGCGLRNKYQKNLDGDYILHCDDDDVYIEGSIKKIKDNHSDDKTINFFKFYTDYSINKFVWTTPKLNLSDIGTPSGIIPNVPENFGTWGYRYGGDFDFYNSCKFNHNFIDEFIYVVKPRQSGYL